MLRLLKKKSLRRKAWCMGSFLCREIDEQVYANVSHRLQRCGGVETRVKLSAKGWSAGGGHNMPSQFYGLDMISAVQPDTVFVNVLLCVFRRADDAADFPFETVAYKFDSAGGPRDFQQLFKSLCAPSVKNTGPALIKKQSVLPARGTTAGRAAAGGGKRGGVMPGRPTHGVMGTVAPERWAARDRATPRLFASRSLDDLLDENTATLHSRHRRHSVDNLDDDDDDYSLDNELTEDGDADASTCSTSSLQPAVVLPADVALARIHGAMDGAWWSEDDEATTATRVKDVGVAATFPDATDSLRQQRRAGLECWTNGNDLACQAYMTPATTKTTDVTQFFDDDDDDYDDAADEFKWVFSSDDEDEQLAFDSSFGAALAQVDFRQSKAASARQAESAMAAGRDEMASDPVKHRYSRRVDQHQRTSRHSTHHQQQHAFAPGPASPAMRSRTRPVSQHKSSSRRHRRLPGLHVMTSSSRRPRDVPTQFEFRRVRSETSLTARGTAGDHHTAAAAAAGNTVVNTAGAARGLPVSRPVSSARSLTGGATAQRRRVYSMSDHRRVY